MSINRRTILKGLAAAPVAVAAPALAAPVASSLTPAPITTVASKYPWQWWVSFDGGECYSESFDTREKAMAAAKAEGGGLIAECRQQDFDLRVDADRLLDMLRDQADDDGQIGEGDWIDVTSEQARDLEDRLHKVMLEWVAAHNINTTAWTFGSVRSKEKIADALKEPQL